MNNPKLKKININNIYFGKKWTEQMLSSYLSNFGFSPTAVRNKKSMIHRWNYFFFDFTSIADAFFISVSEHLINIQSKLLKKRMVDDPWILLKLLEVSLTRTGTCMHDERVFTFYHESEHLMLCLVNLVKILSYPVGRSSFTEQDSIY